MHTRPSPGIGGLQHALLAWTYEVFPEATSASLVLSLDDEDFAAIRVQVPGVRPRWPGWPRAYQARQMIERLTVQLYPEAERATIILFVGDQRTGLVPILLD